MPTSSADGSLVLSADLQSSGKPNQAAKTLGRNEAVVYVRLLRLEGLEIARNESARQGYPDGAQTPRGLDRRLASCRGTNMAAKEKKKPNQKGNFRFTEAAASWKAVRAPG